MTILLPAVQWWRRALHVRVAALTMVLSLVLVGGLAVLLAGEVADRLFEAKTASVLTDAAATRDEAVDKLAGMDVTEPADIEQFLRDLVASLEGQAEGSDRNVILRRNANNPSDTRLLDPVGASVDAISPELAEALSTSTGQFYQPITMPPREEGVPGLIVGQQVAVPSAGPYDLYLLYDLRTEQQTLSSVQRALIFGGVGLVLVLGAVAWLVSRFVVSPIREAAQAANRLAAGNLDERLPVRSEDELASLARSFNGMADSLQHQIEAMSELSRMQRRFVSDVSHELRTPLTTIRMAAEVIGDAAHTLDPAPRRSAELLCNQIDRFEQLLADLLEISRFDAGAAELDVETVDAVSIVHGVVELLRPLADARRVEINVTTSEPAITVSCDRLRLERIARNLLVNAIEHSEGKPISITLGADEACVALVVRDHGVGIDHDSLERVFDRFWRADPARARTTGGTGLGLSIAREDARLHGGELDVWGQLGRGAAFRLTLPREEGHPINVSCVSLPDRGLALRNSA